MRRSDDASGLEAHTTGGSTRAADAGSEPSSTESTVQGPRGPSLPEITVTNVGLHIGGGPNDDATKAPFERAVRPHFEQFLRCYRYVNKPEAGGTFGVDLFIPREGGNPDVRQPRTGMGPEAFRDCVIEAFKQIEFERPKLGPTVISYSIRFDVHDETRAE